MSNVTTMFAGFDLPDAAANLSFAATMTPGEIAQTTAMLTTLEKKALEEIEKDRGVGGEDAKAAIKEIVRLLFSVAQKTTASGKVDGGGVLVLRDTDPKLQLAAGAYVADGQEFDQALRKAVNLASKQPGFPGVNLGVDSHRGVTFHTVTMAAPDQEAKKVFGDDVKMAVGIGERAVFFAIGGDPVSLLKQIIDKSGTPAAAPPMSLKIALTPIIKFAQMVDGAPQTKAALEALAKSAGRDHLTVSVRTVPNGALYRISVEDGILQAIGQGVKGAIGAGGGGF
jgi:hypothetical protein